MKKLSPSTIAILRALAKGAAIRWELMEGDKIIYKDGKPTFSKRRRLTLQGFDPGWTYLTALLNKAFDILAPRGYIATAKTSADPLSRVYQVTPAGIQFLKSLA